MKSAMFPTVDDNGNTIIKSGWGLPKEFTTQRADSKDWDKGLTFAERMTIAERKIKEQEHSKPPRSPRKPNKKNNHEL
jgi:hypothetical protein